MFAIVDVSRRGSRGQILMIVDDQPTAAVIAQELNQRATNVSVQAITHRQLAQVQADARAGGAPARARAIA